MAKGKEGNDAVEIQAISIAVDEGNLEKLGASSGVGSHNEFSENNEKSGTVSDNSSSSSKRESYFKYFFRPPKRQGFLKLNNPKFFPGETWRRIADEKDDISRTVPTPTEPVHGLSEGIHMPFVGDVRWVTVKRGVKEWLRSPKNLALLIWGIAVGISGAILFLVMVGMLNKALPKKRDRDAWFEVSNQILNALFTMMCLYQHPQRFYHLALLCRWKKPDDIVTLRKVYCKNGSYKPHEWTHMMVVVLLLHLNCFSQYVLCGLNWGFKRSDRPAIGVGLCLSLAIGAPAVAGLYLVLSPLGKDYEPEDYEPEVELGEGSLAAPEQMEESVSVRSRSTRRLLERRLSFASKQNRRIEIEPEWQGGLFDCWRDPSVAFFSTFCGFCVFGWNMDRLGLGNMYVHIVTFILFCMAPFWIFNLAAINIDDVEVREALGISGILLCIFGLLYGGFWRTQLRRKFGLPENKWCFGRANLTDYVQWLFCSICSLSQEVRTGDYYELYYDKLMSGQNPTCASEIPTTLTPPSHDIGSPNSIASAAMPNSLSRTYVLSPTGNSVLSQQFSPKVRDAEFEQRKGKGIEHSSSYRMEPMNELKHGHQLEKAETESEVMRAPDILIIRREESGSTP